MKNLTTLFLALIATTSLFSQDAKKSADIEAIKSMVGCYKVTFDFAETFSPDTAYEYYDRYSTSGIEYVTIVADEPNFISFQHLLVINDTMVIKHWRQDWVYEEKELLVYDKDQTWKKISFTDEEVAGTWTQKVFQVDDSPRYEAKGTWVHVDGKHYWEATGDAPLPRREYTKRSDYNVMRRNSRVEITENGWFLEQDNEKIVRDETGDKVICYEKGMEAFTSGDYSCQTAVDYWEKNSIFWNDVRLAWDELFEENQTMKMKAKVDNKHLWQNLFEMGGTYDKSTKKHRAEIKECIAKYMES